VGTGSTVAFFIQALGRMKHRIEGAVSSSEQSTRLLTELGIPCSTSTPPARSRFTWTGADECDPHRRLIKGGGAALTREKIIAEASKQFVCIIDASKQVSLLGKFPVPVEVIPMARSLVARECSSSAASRSGAKAWSPTTATGSSTCTTGSWRIRWRWKANVNQLTAW
jgi:ribose 5-phosphate isomerase A